jgi:hypothetical protein
MFAVEFGGETGEMHISVIVLANGSLEALDKAWRLFPEYKHESRGGHVYMVEYVEVDWHSGRTLIVRRRDVPPTLKLRKSRAPKRAKRRGGQRE